MLRRVKLILPILLCLVISSFGPVEVNEMNYLAKFAYINNFTLFTNWPDVSHQNFRDKFSIALWKDDPLGGVKSKFSKETKVKGKPVSFKTILSAQESRDMDIVFFPKYSKISAEELNQIHKQGILTIGETSGFCKKGGMINFVTVNDKLMFEINKTSVDTYHFKINPRLLKLAKSLY